MTDAPAAPRLMLIAGGAPQRLTAGSVFSHDLCRYYPPKRLCYAALVDRPGASLEQRWLGFPIRCIPDPCPSPPPRFARGWSRLAAGPLHALFTSRRLKSAMSAARHFAQQHRVEMIWAILNCPGTILLARRLAAALGLPLVASVWDPPEYLADDLALAAPDRRRLLREFERTLRSAARCALASEGMRDEYRRRYGIEGIVHIHGVHPRLRQPGRHAPAAEDRLIIGVAGNLYARGEWETLLAALSAQGWRVGGREVIVRVLSGGIQAAASGPARIEYLGWRPLPETIHALADTDVAYLPYWFDQRRRLSVRLCFPNKLTTYLAAGVPVLFHGPQDSSVARFLQRYPAGLCCHSLDQAALYACLRRLAGDRPLYRRAVAAGQAALDQELNLDVFLGRFAQLLGIDRGALLPITTTAPRRPAPAEQRGEPAPAAAR